MATPTDAKCAACGKGGDGLKKCGACELVRYCGAACQRAHRPKHKKECNMRAAELHDEALFKQPPSREDCPICFLELPVMASLQMYKSCCGKILCRGCSIASAQDKTRQSDESPCPFCRKPVADSTEEEHIRIERRVELNDPNAIFMLGFDCFMGEQGSEQDIDKALELFHRAADLGSIDAHNILGTMYGRGIEVPEDNKKTKYHFEIAAIAGHVLARHNLGALEGNSGNDDRAMKHYLLSASAGLDASMKMVTNYYRDGLVTKDDLEKTLRAHKKSNDELKSELRDRAGSAVASWSYVLPRPRGTS